MMQTYIGTKIIKAEIVDQGDPDRDKSKDGYKVVYPDGYESWSPRDVFEAAYTPLTKMSFSHALVLIKDGKSVTRLEWNESRIWAKMWLSLQGPDSASGITVPYICLNIEGDKLFKPAHRFPWTPSQIDVLADDWSVF